jgi:hypothetical protein
MGTELTKSVKYTGNIPKKDSDIDDTGQQVLASWAANPLMTLIWTDREAFETSTSSFSSALGEKQDISSGRSGITRQLANLDKSMNKGCGFIKDYLNEKFGKEEAPSYFANFGIVKVGREYILPRDRNKRSDALVLMLKGITTHGFGAKPYGTSYWTPIKTQYDDLRAQAVLIDETVSSKVGDKNMYRKDIVKTLNALIHLIKANYPDDYKNVLRTWGFQKDKY